MISTTTNRMDYTGNGVATVYAYAFLVLAQADLKVYVDGILKTLTTDYSVSGVGVATGGNVTFVTAPANGKAIVILRDVPLTQAVDYVENEKFPADTHEQALDKLTMIAQQIKETFGRAIKFSTTSTLKDVDFPEGTGASNRAAKFPRWNVAGTALELISVGVDAVTGVITTLGDLIQGGPTGVPERLAAGARGAVLQIAGASKAAWLALGAKGGILVSDGTDSKWKAAGANGQFLKADSAQADGLVWAGVAFAFGSSRIARDSATQLSLSIGIIPLKVSSAWISRAVPAAVTISNTGLVASTVYNVYAFDNAGTTALELSTIGHSTDTELGVEVKTGDASRTLVGKIRTEGSTPGQFVDSATQRFVISWFNRRNIGLANNFTVDRTTASGTYVELNAEIRCEFLAWGDEAVSYAVNGFATLSIAATAFTSVGFDGTNKENAMSGTGGPTGTNYGTAFGGVKTGLAEGYHYATVLGATNGGATGTWKGAAYAADTTAASIDSLLVGTRG